MSSTQLACGSLGALKMSNQVLSPPLFGFELSTRAVGTFGVGLLLADRVGAPRRRAVGRTLVPISPVTTIPALVSVLSSPAARQIT